MQELRLKIDMSLIRLYNLGTGYFIIRVTFCLNEIIRAGL